MEALTAVAVAALTIYDMVKAVDKAMVIGDIRLERKSGRAERKLIRATVGDAVRAIEIHQSCNPEMSYEYPPRRHQPGRGVGPAAALRRCARAATFPQHTFLEAWDREALRRLPAEADAAFAAVRRPRPLPSLPRLRWVQARRLASRTCFERAGGKLRSS